MFINNKNQQKTLLNSTFTLLVSAYLLTLHLTPYQFQPLLKASPIYILMVIVFTQIKSSTKYFYLAALAASSFGDVFLATSITHSFILGLASFLIAHLFYLIVFIKSQSGEENATTNNFLISLIILFSVVMATYILPATAELLVPVAIYLLVITVMATTAFKKNMHKLTLLGVISFLISDSILALSIFKTPLPQSDYLVMVTYYLAQSLIISGVISTESKRNS